MPIARASQLFLPTLRDDPAEAEAASHKLLVRGGFIRQVSAGVWTYLPIGWRVHQKIVQIVREEMDAIGGQEMLMPLLTPAELWQRSGRYGYPEVYKLSDRFDRCGLEFYQCESDVGLMGGSGAHEYLAPCEAGENAMALCERRDYFANVEVATGVATAPEFGPERA